MNTQTLITIGIPISYQVSIPAVRRIGHCSLENFIAAPRAVTQLREAAKRQASVIISCPTSGAGKSHLGIGYLLECLRLDRIEIPQFEDVIVQVNGREASRREERDPAYREVDPATYCYVRADDLIAEVAKGFEGEERFKFYVGRRGLLIDEVGRTAVSYGSKSIDDKDIMMRLLSKRIDEMRLTVIITPLPVRVFMDKSHYDGSIIRRLKTNGGEVIELPQQEYKQEVVK